jgi:hypothetical protein
MNKIEFNPGDKVYHKSNSSIVWIIEKIENDEAYCSTVNNDTRQKSNERFALVTIAKINDQGYGGIMFGNSRDRDRNRY